MLSDRIQFRHWIFIFFVGNDIIFVIRQFTQKITRFKGDMVQHGMWDIVPSQSVNETVFNAMSNVIRCSVQKGGVHRGGRCGYLNEIISGGMGSADIGIIHRVFRLFDGHSVKLREQITDWIRKQVLV